MTISLVICKKKKKSEGRCVWAWESLHVYISIWSCNTCKRKKKKHQQLVIYAGDKGVKICGWQGEESAGASAIQRHENEISGARPRLRYIDHLESLVCPFCCGHSPNALSETGTGTLTKMPSLKRSPWDLFCSGHIKLSRIRTQINIMSGCEGAGEQ